MAVRGIGFLRIVRISTSSLASSSLLRNAQLPQAHVGLTVSHALSEVDLWSEVLAQPRFVDKTVELVDLLEGKTLRLVNQSPDEKDGDQAASTPDEEHLGLKIGVICVHEVRCRPVSTIGASN